MYQQERIVSLPSSARGITWVMNPSSPYHELREKLTRIQIILSAEDKPLKVNGVSDCLRSKTGTLRNNSLLLTEKPEKLVKKVKNVSERLFSKAPIKYVPATRDPCSCGDFWYTDLRSSVMRSSDLQPTRPTSVPDNYNRYVKRFFTNPLKKVANCHSALNKKYTSIVPPRKLSLTTTLSNVNRLAITDVRNRLQAKERLIQQKDKLMRATRALRSIAGGAFDYDFYNRSLGEFAERDPRPLGLKEMIKWYDSGVITEDNVIVSAQNLHRELPIRLAKSLVSFELLPLIVLEQPGMLKVFKDYSRSFDILSKEQRPLDLPESVAYNTVVLDLIKMNADLLTSLSQGVANCRTVMSFEETLRLDKMVHQFIGYRLSRRFLAANHAAVYDHFISSKAPPGEVGVFHRAAPISVVVNSAAEEAQELCHAEFGQFPELYIDEGQDITLFCVPVNLQAVLVEVLKNSMKATVERHGNNPTMPPVRCSISKNKQGTAILCLSDSGGGMSASNVASLWRYGTSGRTILDTHGKVRDYKSKESLLGIRDMHTQRLSGYGFGLPLSKARTNYFGGDLWVRNMEGHGVDTFIKMLPATQRWVT